MSESEWIRGSGGGKGGKGGGAPKEDDNTLFSVSKARVIDLVSEGEIEGLINGDKSIFINQTPLQDASGTYNYDDFSYITREGTNSQTYIPGFQGTENTTAVSTLVVKGSPGPIIRTFTSSIVDAVRVTLYVNALSDINNDESTLHGSSVSFKIYLDKDSSGSWVEVRDHSISGKTGTKYERSYRFDIPAAWKSSGYSTISIKVERTTADATSSKVSNELFFGSFTQIIDNKLRYPNSALIATQIDSRQFDSIPTRGYEIKGVKVKVPSNYTPYDPGHCSLGGYRRKDSCTSAGGTWTGTPVGTTLYDGTWDGTFDVAWTSNPAWILYDLCTENRYGLGRWLSDNQIDKWALYEIAKYCDAVDNLGRFQGVDDGWTNKEARFTCNVYLQSSEEAYKVVGDIASIFRGMLYWQQGMITPVQDAPKDPIMNFSEANTIGGEFTYEGTSRKQRHNVALVTWNNPEDLYKQNTEYVEDAAGILAAHNQIFSTQVRAVGCTSQAQARRIGKWVLYTEKYETEVVTFKTGMEGAGVRPGDLIKIADPARAGVRYGGRVSSGGNSSLIKLDSSTPLTGGTCNDTTYTTKATCEAASNTWTDGPVYNLSLINAESACVRNGIKRTTVSSTTTASTTGKLIDTTQYFTSSLLGTTVTRNAGGTATVTAVDSTTQLSLDTHIITNGEVYTYAITNQESCLNENILNEWKPFTWVETRAISEDGTWDYASTNVTELSFDDSFTNTPTTEYMWILEEIGNVEAQDFRVLATRETEQNLVEVSALKYHVGKYNLIENNIEFSAKSTSILPDPAEKVPEPGSLAISEELYLDSRNTIKNRATFSWDAPVIAGTAVLYPYTASYYVEWRRTTPTISNWYSLGETTATSVVIDDAPAGNLEFRVKTRRIY
jgi:predicted phage tail protein|tara:strand:- start:4343 stop:7024 length:2682 start_codon:yes stop_codon:yes gene_type:complete